MCKSGTFIKHALYKTTVLPGFSSLSSFFCLNRCYFISKIQQHDQLLADFTFPPDSESVIKNVI